MCVSLCLTDAMHIFACQASTFQMAVLLQYNQGDSYTVQQLQESTQIKLVCTALSYISRLSTAKPKHFGIGGTVSIIIYV